MNAHQAERVRKRRCGEVLSAGVLLFVLIAFGCATPRARISRNPNLYDPLAPQVKHKVQAGEIEIGFPEEAVFLALGSPDRKYTRETEGGETKVWSYVREYTGYADPWPPYHRVWVTTGTGRYWYDHYATAGFWYSRVEREYEYLRVEFKDGKVVAIERLADDEAED